MTPSTATNWFFPPLEPEMAGLSEKWCNMLYFTNGVVNFLHTQHEKFQQHVANNLENVRHLSWLSAMVLSL